MLSSQFFIIAVILAFLPVYASSCSDNEIEADCVNPCNTCEQRGQCDLSFAPCRRGCDCKPGFFRDENGFCVPGQQCLAKTENVRCPKNAVFLPCVPLPLPTCENLFPDPDYDDECVPGCACRPGFLKRKDGLCVTNDQCYNKEDLGKGRGLCQEDEEYYECTPSCKNTCENINNPGAKCRCGPPGCFCKKDLVKRADGKCIQPQHCPRSPSPQDPAAKCPKNAIFIKCGSPCPPTCDNLQPEPCEEKCVTACYCKPGYLKRKDNVCVRPADCNPRKIQEKPAPKCPENAIFIECGSPCPPTCENRLPETCEEKCTKACYCKPGFLLKTVEGKCVKPENCNTSHIPVETARCPPNEERSECVIPCNDCKIRGNCKFACKKGCDCKRGYFRNKNGKCIPASECFEIVEPQHKCADDEKFYECSPSCKNTCKNIYDADAKCHCGPPGCFCKEGLVKRENGKCINPDQCEAFASCPDNGEFSTCGPACRPTCEDPFPAPCTQQCIKGCFCKTGFVQDRDGRCVRLENCTKRCLRPGEEFQECGSTCPDTCKNRGRPFPGSCPYRCNRGCFCKKGLYRSKKGNCVTLKDCDAEHYSTTSPKPPTTRKNIETTAVTVPDDCHGCPSTAECEAYCKSLGDFVGLCVGKNRRHCRCA